MLKSYLENLGDYDLHRVIRAIERWEYVGAVEPNSYLLEVANTCGLTTTPLSYLAIQLEAYRVAFYREQNRAERLLDRLNSRR